MNLNDYASYVNFTNDPNTTLLYRTNDWKLGASKVKEIMMNAKSKITVHVSKTVSKYILGIPIEYSDESYEQLIID